MAKYTCRHGQQGPCRKCQTEPGGIRHKPRTKPGH